MIAHERKWLRSLLVLTLVIGIAGAQAWGKSIMPKPFIWSESDWAWQPLRDVPDRLDGRFTMMPLYLR